MVQFRRQDNAHWYHETQRSVTDDALREGVCTSGHYGHDDFSALSNSENLTNAFSDKSPFLLGLEAQVNPDLQDLLQQRDETLRASHRMYQTLFPAQVSLSTELTLSLYDRLSSALIVAQVTGVQRLCNHYAERLMPLSSDDASRESNIRLTLLTQYARQLASQPTLINRRALQQLSDSGLTSLDIILFSQIIGFVGYQARAVAAVSALAGYPTVLLPGFPRMEDAESANFSDEVTGWQAWLPDLSLETESQEQEQNLTLTDVLNKHPHSQQIYADILLRIPDPDHHPQPALLELAALVSARINGSACCLVHHRQRYLQLKPDITLINKLQSGISQNLSQSSTESVESSVIHLAAELTRAPERFGPPILAPLQERGFSPLQLMDTLFSVALAGWTNRLVQTLGSPRSALQQAWTD